MRVLITTNLGSNDFPGTPYLHGETREVDDQVGSNLLAKGVAILAPDVPKEVPVQEPKPDRFETLKSQVTEKQPTSPSNKGS